MTESIVVAVVVGLLGAAALLATVRIVRGPSVLDRSVAVDVLVTTMVVALGVEAGLGDHATTLPILVSLSLLGFVGSVSVARFVARDADPSHAGFGLHERDEPPSVDEGAGVDR